MRRLSSNDILKELSRIEERSSNIDNSSNENLLDCIKDFYNHLNSALGAFEELELSINLNENLTENDLKIFIEKLSIDVGKIEEALNSKKKLYQNHKQQFRIVILKIKDTYKYFIMEYEAVEKEINIKIKQYVWLMKQAVYSLDKGIKDYNQKFNENLQVIFEEEV